MKRIYAVGIALFLAIGLMACGGGGEETNDGGGTTASADAMATSFKMMSNSQALVGEIQTAIANALAGQVVKEIGMPVCTVNGDDSYTCTIEDGQGGTAVFSGTWSMVNYAFNFQATFDNFRPDTDQLIDGSFVWTATVNQDAFNDVNAGASTKSATVAKAEDGCEYTEEDFDGSEYCQNSDQVCSDTSADFLMSFDFTVGSGGLTYTDECGTYEYGAGAAMTMDFCMADFDALIALYTGTINGTFNGTAVNESYSISCDFSELL